MGGKHPTTRIAVPPELPVQRIAFAMRIEGVPVRMKVPLTNSRTDNGVTTATS
jgi:hypothetical protein